MTVRNELIVRIVEDRLIDAEKCIADQVNLLTNYQLIQLSFVFERWGDNGAYAWTGNKMLQKHYINALPDSIMRNFRALGDEYNNYKTVKDVEDNIDEIVKGSDGNWQPAPTAYTFDHSSKTDYHLSKGFIDWLNMEYKKIKGIDIP